jgi:hypothetical protein
MERIREKCIDFFSSEDVKKNIIQPTVEYLYNETYLYIWIFVAYQIFFISILITILIILLKIFNSFHNKYSDIEKNNIN